MIPKKFSAHSVCERSRPNGQTAHRHPCQRLDRRIISRPRRFDRIVKIGTPSPAMRLEYLKRKLEGRTVPLAAGELAEWVRASEGLSFAALADLVINVRCLGKGLAESAEQLRAMLRGKGPSSDEYTRPGGRAGFATPHTSNGAQGGNRGSGDTVAERNRD